MVRIIKWQEFEIISHFRQILISTQKLSIQSFLKEVKAELAELELEMVACGPIGSAMAGITGGVLMR